MVTINLILFDKGFILFFLEEKKNLLTSNSIIS